MGVLTFKVVPVVEDSECLSQFKHLPILFINNWQEVTPKMLLDKVDHFMTSKFDFAMLDIEYWRKII